MLMPAQAPKTEHEWDQTPSWIVLASMFVGRRLDKGAAVGAYVAAVATFAVSLIVLFAAPH